MQRAYKAPFERKCDRVKEDLCEDLKVKCFCTLITTHIINYILVVQYIFLLLQSIYLQ